MARIDIQAIDDELKKKFLSICKEKQITASSMIREYIKKVVKDHEKKNN